MIRRQRLLEWYRNSRRDLPFRARRDPYSVWISEVLLQQTRVETAVPYYLRFMDRYPTLEALAAGSDDELLALWSGLGYYRRARDLLRAARQLVSSGGDFPRSAALLEELPGIGPYTAAAIASIAFDEPVVALDGNAERVLARLAACREDARSRRGRLKLLALAATLLDPGAPGESNQALMELGATVCLPRRPRCESCPLRSACRGRRSGKPETFPLRRRRVATRRVHGVVLAIRERDRWLLVRRKSAEALLAGLWEFPTAEGVAAPRAAATALRELYGGNWQVGREIARFRHAITSRSLHLSLRRGTVEGDGVAENGFEAGWFDREALADLALSGSARKVARRLGALAG